MICEELRERMTAVAHGRAQWTASESGHLRECDACRREWQIIRGAASLGDSLVLDADRIAASVALRLAAEPGGTARPRRFRAVPWLVGMAAAAIGFAVLARPANENFVPPVESAVLTELDGLSAPELEAVLDMLAPVEEEVPAVDPARLGDLNTQELERVLRSLEG